MLSSIFIALLQAAAGDPAVTETPAAEAPAAAAPRMERVRVCRTYEAATGGRLSQRRCRWEERPVRDEAPATDGAADTGAETTTDDGAATRDTEAGGHPAAASPSAPSPQ
jgi:hypothetical protein